MKENINKDLYQDADRLASNKARLNATLGSTDKHDPGLIVESIVDLAIELGETQCDEILHNFPELFDHTDILKRMYTKYILDMESAEVQQLLCNTVSTYRSFIDIGSEAALMAYNRVSSLFDMVDFNRHDTFVLIGCGQLPITALHVLDKTQIENIICIDVSEQAIDAVEKIKSKYNLDRIEVLLTNGTEYDFSNADIIYIANMVCPKIDVFNRVLETAKDNAQVVVREPYSFGRFWTDRLEDNIPSNVNITSIGPGSRYLSRDTLIQKRSR